LNPAKRSIDFQTHGIQGSVGIIPDDQMHRLIGSVQGNVEVERGRGEIELSNRHSSELTLEYGVLGVIGVEIDAGALGAYNSAERESGGEGGGLARRDGGAIQFSPRAAATAPNLGNNERGGAFILQNEVVKHIAGIIVAAELKDGIVAGQDGSIG
jgi:hypothetical protein